MAGAAIATVPTGRPMPDLVLPPTRASATLLPPRTPAALVVTGARPFVVQPGTASANRVLPTPPADLCRLVVPIRQAAPPPT